MSSQMMGNRHSGRTQWARLQPRPIRWQAVQQIQCRCRIQPFLNPCPVAAGIYFSVEEIFCLLIHGTLPQAPFLLTRQLVFFSGVPFLQQYVLFSPVCRRMRFYFLDIYTYIYIYPYFFFMLLTITLFLLLLQHIVFVKSAPSPQAF